MALETGRILTIHRLGYFYPKNLPVFYDFASSVLNDSSMWLTMIEKLQCIIVTLLQKSVLMLFSMFKVFLWVCI